MQGWEGQFLLVSGIKALKGLTGKETLTSLIQHTQTSLFWELCFGDHLTYRRVLYSMLCYSGVRPPSTLPRRAFPFPTITFRSRCTPSHLFPLPPVLGVAVCEWQGEEGSGVSHRSPSQFYTIMESMLWNLTLETGLKTDWLSSGILCGFLHSKQPAGFRDSTIAFSHDAGKMLGLENQARMVLSFCLCLRRPYRLFVTVFLKNCCHR